MSSSIYSALSGARAAWTEMEMVSNNLANSTSDGFKEHRMTFKAQRVSEQPLGKSFVKIAETVHNMADGTMETTGVDTHLALQAWIFYGGR